MSPADIPSHIIAMERAALDRSDRGDPVGFLEISAPDVSYFDPFLDKPIRGLENLREYYKGFPQGGTDSGKMIDPQVQVVGDVAVLTFNYVSKSSRWNTTEVYRRTPAGWRIIHTNWSYMKPELKEKK